MSDYVLAGSTPQTVNHPLSGSGKMIPNPLENQFYSGSDAGFRSLPAVEPSNVGALWQSSGDVRVKT